MELTLDLDLQQSVEDTLAAKVDQLNKKDGLTNRGAAAAVIKVGTGEILALASCPTYDLSTYRKDYNELSADPAKPIFNRATSSPYAPGSTLKPATAVAALESGVTTTTCTSLFMEGLLINKVSTLAANEGATHTKRRAINRSFFFFIVCYNS